MDWQRSCSKALCSTLILPHLHVDNFCCFCFGRVTAVDGQYQIGIYSLRPIAYGEEITFDYNSVTEVSFFSKTLNLFWIISYDLYHIFFGFVQSKEEYEASVCLCGNHVCRGSYLNLAGEGAFQKVYSNTSLISGLTSAPIPIAILSWKLHVNAKYTA